MAPMQWRERHGREWWVAQPLCRTALVIMMMDRFRTQQSTALRETAKPAAADVALPGWAVWLQWYWYCPPLPSTLHIGRGSRDSFAVRKASSKAFLAASVCWSHCFVFGPSLPPARQPARCLRPPAHARPIAPRRAHHHHSGKTKNRRASLLFAFRGLQRIQPHLFMHTRAAH